VENALLKMLPIAARRRPLTEIVFLACAFFTIHEFPEHAAGWMV
jgi:hypothetical protein